MSRNQLCIWMSSVQFGLKNLSHPSLHEFRGKKKMRRKGWLSFADTLVLSSAGKGRTMAFQSSHVLPLDGVEATSVANKVFLVPLFFCRHENSILLLVVELGWLGCLTFLCSPITMKSVNFKGLVMYYSRPTGRGIKKLLNSRIERGTQWNHYHPEQSEGDNGI